MSASRDKGTRGETAVVEVARPYFPFLERAPLWGAHDRGDLLGSPGLVWEIKNQRVYSIGAWLTELDAEMTNAGAGMGVLVVKPNGVGYERAGQWWAIRPLSLDLQLLTEAGYAAPPGVQRCPQCGRADP